jgi:hypothetical protein
MSGVTPQTQGNLSIGYDLTVEQGTTVTEGYSSGNNLSLPGFNGPFPPVPLYWGGSSYALFWGSGLLNW